MARRDVYWRRAAAVTAVALAIAGCRSSESGPAPAEAPPSASHAEAAGAEAAGDVRIVSASGNVTEVLYALGLGAQVVGVDTTSTYPPATSALPKIGYLRRLSAEGIVSL